MAPLAFGTMVLLVSPTHAEETLLLKLLLAKEMKLINAIQAKDKATLQEMPARQKYCIEPGKGRLQTEALFDHLDNTELTSFTRTNAKAISVGDRGVILSNRNNWKGAENGKPVKLVSFATFVWDQDDGDWRSVCYEETAVDV